MLLYGCCCSLISSSLGLCTLASARCTLGPKGGRDGQICSLQSTFLFFQLVFLWLSQEMNFILSFLSLHSSGLFFLLLITSWHTGQVQSPLKDACRGWRLIEFLEVCAIWLPGRWEWPTIGISLRESEAEFSFLAAVRGQSLCIIARQHKWMDWPSCPRAAPGWLQHRRFHVQDVSFTIDGQWE